MLTQLKSETRPAVGYVFTSIYVLSVNTGTSVLDFPINKNLLIRTGKDLQDKFSIDIWKESV